MPQPGWGSPLSPELVTDVACVQSAPPPTLRLLLVVVVVVESAGMRMGSGEDTPSFRPCQECQDCHSRSRDSWATAAQIMQLKLNLNYTYNPTHTWFLVIHLFKSDLWSLFIILQPSIYSCIGVCRNICLYFARPPQLPGRRCASWEVSNLAQVSLLTRQNFDTN